ncbi:MAG: PQQ-binding-like beta-propeller repeat protein, partial [Planctomycetes bacterium]|nr:PQQ-binding-like beta-propeller repeat protein [Planctomycetota bacterium]
MKTYQNQFIAPKIDNKLRSMVPKEMIASVLVFLFCLMPLAADVAQRIRESGIKGGVVALINCRNTKAISTLAQNSSYLIHILDHEPQSVEKTRKVFLSKGLYGHRVTAVHFQGSKLPYADNTINLLVADSLGTISTTEVMRVLSPLGVMMIGGKKTIKPWPKEIDDWPQYLNKADNNGVAMDSVVGPPRRLQWVGDLVWARSHMAIATTISMVTGNGRLFAIEDRAVTDNPYLPTEFHIVARDAFNGRELWRKPITQWESITNYIKCLPVQQQRRMAVAGDTLYCTFELEGEVSAVDAATGEVIQTYEGTDPCQEVAYNDGILYLNVGQRFPAFAYNIVKKDSIGSKARTSGEPFGGSGWNTGYDPEIKDSKNPQSVILAIDAKSGKKLWQTDKLNTYTAASLAVKGMYAVYQTVDGLFCLNSKTGELVWDNKKKIGHPLGHDSGSPGTLPNTVVIGGKTVFAVEAGPKAAGKKASVPKNIVIAYDLKSGKKLWSDNCPGNYEASSDVFYIDGKLWVGGGGTPTAYDARTGKNLGTISQKENGPMSHDRCYRNMITEKYYINSKTGGADFLSLSTKD